MDVWDYFEDQRARLQGYEREELEFDAVPGDHAGRISGKLTLTDSAYLKVFEWVETHSGRVEVVEYAYYLIVDGAEVQGWDKDPEGHPERPVHGHIGKDHERVEAPELSLDRALELAWEYCSWLAEQDFGDY
jgi:hypothetical protein